ncbi:MAG: hydantoinase/oxoprolinase family protein, partial [Alphaproteobacteria bacterium]|nr:hydantoinase/oxoprolinase family protein [Alphaproteobacteria bacterium]
INAYVMPVIRSYLENLRNNLDAAGITAPLMLMQSSGGLMSDRAAVERPCHIIESGPAGGVVGAQALSNLDNIVTFDMGGTTAKAALIEGGAVTRSQQYSVGAGIMIGSRLMTGSGYLLKTPAIDLAEVGAGGGSLVWIDAGGSLQVGPESAGADPGPLVYDQGGTEPTVTDANVLLGYLNPNHLVGGELPLNPAKAEAAFAERIAKPLGLGVAEAAYGAHLIAAANMIRAIKAVSSERGRDPRAFSLFAFGGNGPVFAAGMAESLGMDRVVIPPSPGLFSSFGLLQADIEQYHSRTLNRLLREVDPQDLTGAWNAVADEARAELRREGFADERISIIRVADLHYKGQIYDLSVPAPEGDFDAAKMAMLEEAFGEEHLRTYGHRAGPEEPVELVNLRVIAKAESDSGATPVTWVPQASGPTTTRQAYFGKAGWCDTPILGRGDLETETAGPAIIEEYDATCVIPPAWSGRLDAEGSIILTTRSR